MIPIDTKKPDVTQTRCNMPATCRVGNRVKITGERGRKREKLERRSGNATDMTYFQCIQNCGKEKLLEKHYRLTVPCPKASVKSKPTR